MAAAAADPVVIAGGGPIGLTCALLLATRGLRCVVTDARPLEAGFSDPRLLALSRGTWRVLAPLLAAAQMPRTAPITDVYVSSAGEFGATHLSMRDFAPASRDAAGATGPAEPSAGPRSGRSAEPLGATVAYGELLRALGAAAVAQPMVEMRRPLRIAALAQQPDGVQVEFDDGTRLRAALVVHAEGFHEPRGAGASGATQAAPAERPWAVLADVDVSGPAPGAAFERFTREGPLALLPAPRAPLQPAHAGARALSLVWCTDAGAAAARAALPEREFIDELQRAIGARIGRVVAVGPRRHVALPSGMRERVREHRTVWLGNAAQTLHPVAGQGFNLGVRDCATLSRCLAESRNDAMAALASYAERRRLDRRAIEAVTQWLPGVFATTFAPMAAARTLALAALDLLPAARREFARLLMFGVRS
jgi:2-octaprenyl-6-methoxyphenol hydroxylase